MLVYLAAERFLLLQEGNGVLHRCRALPGQHFGPTRRHEDVLAEMLQPRVDACGARQGIDACCHQRRQDRIFQLSMGPRHLRRHCPNHALVIPPHPRIPSDPLFLVDRPIVVGVQLEE
jgi:hypothetical protein|eukprot:SAG25_NODE_50_length_18801_cov_117.737729_3_plen_118_part_00